MTTYEAPVLWHFMARVEERAPAENIALERGSGDKPLGSTWLLQAGASMVSARTCPV